ncbi:uncharacterized protein RAG0_04029 [Rhynchosporium agropyri]|uniref:Uncharacterized protein n=1 Tax=Rhynchosporium agropyri TaxID=914238 RepID=A0A1E1K7E4_9HELO|nr:uncharacterized protein RAG0_04029 [Rhynchosporium agropyri]
MCGRRISQKSGNLRSSFQVVYDEGWGKLRNGTYPEFGLTNLVRSIDPARLIDSTSGFFDLGAGNLALQNVQSAIDTVKRRQDRRDYKGLALTPPCPPQRA